MTYMSNFNKIPTLFIWKTATEMKLLNTVEDLSHRIALRKTTDPLIRDFRKLFTTVPHRRLLLQVKH